MTDPISDMLTRIRNAQMVKHKIISIPYSEIKYKIAMIFEREGFVDGVIKRGRKTKKIIEVALKYDEEGKPSISELKRISRPGRRVYVSKDELFKIKGGFGMSVLSTSKGIMTNKEARKEKVGGELICEIW